MHQSSVLAASVGLLATLLIACAPGNSSRIDAGGVDGSLDAGGEDAGERDGSVDAGPPVTLSLEPVDGSSGISVLASPIATASADLDPSTLELVTVDLIDRLGTTIEIDVSYSPATREITIDPVRALVHKMTYSVAISGLVAADGRPVAPVAGTFSTFINPYTKGTYYSGGLLDSQVARENDALGRLTLSTHIRDPGPDGVWQTVDDLMSKYLRYAYPIGAIEIVEYTEAGVDGIWLTADDLPARCGRITLDTRGNWDARIDSLPGPDGACLTVDDVISMRTEFTYEPGVVARQTYFFGPGPDGQWQTGDDEIGGVWDLRRLNGYRFAESIRYDGPGADGQWYTADDDVYAFTRVDHDDLAGTANSWVSAGPGVDGVWGSADDPIRNNTLALHDSDGLRLSSTTWSGPGLDGRWDSGNDDWVSSRRLDTRDANGNLIRQTRSLDPGPDGTWHTGDDELSSISDYDPTL